MIFWWSESKLAKFIDECVRRGYISDIIDSLNEEIEIAKKSTEKNKRNINALANAFNEIKTEKASGEKDIPIDVESIVAIVEDRIKNITDQNAKDISLIARKIENVEHAQLKQTDIELIAKKVVSDNKTQIDNSQNEEYERLTSKVENIEKTISFISSERITDEKVRSIVDQYVKSQRLSTPIIDENAIIQNIKSECIASANSLISQNNAAINGVINAHSSEIKRISEIAENANNNEIMIRLQADYEIEKRKAEELSAKVKSQEISIESLMSTISELTKRLEVLEKGKGPEIPQYPSGHFEFGTDLSENEKNLDVLMSQARILKDRIIKLCGNSDDVYVKLVDNLIDRVEKLIEKNKEKGYSSDKLANEVSKILKQTIIKGMSQEKVKAEIQDYMDACGIRKLEWKIGKKITDNDYEYLEEPIIYVDVDSEDESGTVVAIIQDTYVIDYIEDDEKYETIIPGIYRIGKYNR